MPTAIAVCWSSAMARSATPEIVKPSSGTGRGRRDGMPANASAAAPRMNAPRPMVTMISEIRGRPTNRRSTMRLKSTASVTMPAHPRPSDPASPRPKPCTPTATSRDASIIHSPRAKLIIRAALYTTTKARATSA